MKLCKDCKHHHKIPGITNRCYHPKNSIDLVTGYPEWSGCSGERWHGWLMTRLEHTCGKEGRYFEAKS